MPRKKAEKKVKTDGEQTLQKGVCHYCGKETVGSYKCEAGFSHASVCKECHVMKLSHHGAVVE